MRLVILTQYYPPEVGAPQGRLSDLAERLQRKGHQVTVVTAMPHYPTLEVAEPWRGKLWGEEDIGGVRVLRSWIYVPKGRSTARQLGNYGSFVATALLSGTLRLRRADVLLWESPPLFLAPTAFALAQRLQARLVMNVSDLWPMSAVDLGILQPGVLLRGFEWLERKAYGVANLVMGQTEHILNTVRQASPTAATHLFPNGVDTDFFRPHRDCRDQLPGLGKPGRCIVGYAGTFGRAQALEQVLGAADLLSDEPIDFVLVGDGPRREALVAEARRLGLSNVTFLPSQPRSAMPELLSALDVALVCLADREVFKGARPSKMFELLATETPVIYCGKGEGADLALSSGGARVVEPEAPDELARAVRGMLALSLDRRRAMGAAARQFVRENFDRASIASQVENALLTLGSDDRSIQSRVSAASR